MPDPIRLSPFYEIYLDLCHGHEHPTHIYVGSELWEFLFEKAERFINENRSINFNDAQVFEDRYIPPRAAHFWTMSEPFHPRFNRYVDFAKPEPS